MRSLKFDFGWIAQSTTSTGTSAPQSLDSVQFLLLLSLIVGFICITLITYFIRKFKK